jgi:hypothetical protein
MNIISPQSTIICTTAFDPLRADTDFRISVELDEETPSEMVFVNLSQENVQVSCINRGVKLPAKVYPPQETETLSYAFSAGRKEGLDEPVREEDVRIGLKVNDEIVDTTTVTISC